MTYKEFLARQGIVYPQAGKKEKPAIAGQAASEPPGVPEASRGRGRRPKTGSGESSPADPE
jgi:hypothetical protein